MGHHEHGHGHHGSHSHGSHQCCGCHCCCACHCCCGCHCGCCGHGGGGHAGHGGGGGGHGGGGGGHGGGGGGKGGGGRGGGGRGKGGGWTIPTFPLPGFPGNTNTNYTPFLVIRTLVGDFGGRPLPPGTVFWESPDVWVLSSAGVNQPVVGEPNTLFARVSNFGLEQVSGVAVKFWWANPSIAITEASANLIGVAFVTIPARRSLIVQCPTPWVPIVENGGHECLLAEAYQPIFDPLTAPMDPTVDRHVGQHNEQLVTVGPGGSFEAVVQAANIAPLQQAVAMELHTAATGLTTALIAAHHGLDVAHLMPASTPLSLDLDVGTSAGTPIEPTEAFGRGLVALGPSQAGGDLSAPVAAQAVALDPWESRTVTVAGTVPADAQPGETHVVRLIQRIGPVVVGGYSVSVVIG
jgi:hypothetical protein